MTEHAISVDGLSFSYGALRAVDEISFHVAPGEVLGFLGPNGAGKSTTIKMLTGQLPPDTGSISILGLTMPAQREQIQARMGVCFEEKNLYSAMTAAENLRFFARLFGMTDFDPRPLLESVGLATRSEDRVASYSKGMRQRLMVARSLVNRPEVLFLDEPTDGLDPVSARAIRQIIRHEADNGTAVLLTTHDMAEADVLSDRVAFINDGKLLALDSPENLKLQHGRRSVKVRWRKNGTVEERVIDLDGDDSADAIRAAVQVDELMTIHTEEATLEDIFVEYAGRGLDT